MEILVSFELFEDKMYNIQIVSMFVISVGAVIVCNSTTIDQNFENSSELNDYSNLKLVKVSDICGQTLEETQFLIVSPNYPAEYPSYLNCEITLEGPDCPLYYKFRFIDFDVENSTGCVNDRLEIGQTDALCGEKNGTATYFVENGTLKLRFISNKSKSGKGYKILVTRIEECLNETEKFPGTVLTSRGGTFNPNLALCSLDVPENSRHFFIKSPHFPSSMSYLTDCSFQIQKASSDICRLRIRFQFFWFGNSLDCREGYLQIDGKIICGCKKELNLMSPFLENLKMIRFKSEGLVRNSYSGFLAEVYQDNCPKKVESNQTTPSIRTSRSFMGLNQKSMYFPNDRDITEVYYFEYPDSHVHRKEREDVNYLETENINSLLGNNVYDYNNCLQWNQFQFDHIFGGKEDTLDECRRDSNRIHQEKNCVKFFQRKGFFFSPGYPFFYPGQLNLCYRFLKAPSHCGVRIHFLDFRIGPNEDCSQDYMEIGNKGSFCGMKLWNKIVYLDLEKKDYEDIHFVTTYLRCAQGFKAIFEQIPCQAVSTESPYPTLITKIWTEPITSTSKSVEHCGRLIRNEVFTLTNQNGSPTCSYTIERRSEDVCRIILKFEQFYLDCSKEYLTIDGRRYCGNQNGRSVSLDIQSTQIEILYTRIDHSSIGTNFKINGIQDNTNCLEPPPQLTLKRLHEMKTL